MNRLINMGLSICMVFILFGMPWTANPKAGHAAEYEIVALAAGITHSMALYSDGTLWTWGSNLYLQLGDGTDVPSRKQPVKIMDDVSVIAAGNLFSMAIKRDGTLWTWGYNDSGQLGDGTRINRATPVMIMDNVSAIAAGSQHSMALKNDGSLWVWGSNASYQVGDGTPVERTTPQPVMDDVRAIAAGSNHSLAVKQDGSLWAWGNNSGSQLGDGTTSTVRTPKQILDEVIAVDAGYRFSVALRNDGTLWSWGDNNRGQLGDGTTSISATPKLVMDADISKIDAGGSHMLAHRNDGTLWAWGSNNHGQLGDGTQDDITVPKQVLSDVQVFAAGFYHNLAVTRDGTLWGWGDNSSYQSGGETSQDVLLPRAIAFPQQVIYESNGGSDVESQTLNYGAAAVKPADPVWAGYTFEGWYEDAELTTPYDFGKVVTGDLLLYAKWISTDAGIGTLLLDGVTLHEAVSADVLQYTATVDHEFDETQLAVTVRDSGARVSAVTVNGLPMIDSVKLQIGANLIDIEITAEDGITKRNYQIVVTRQASDNALLESMVVDQATLQPVFDPQHFIYTADAPYEVEAVTVTAAVYHPEASLRINGIAMDSGAASELIPLEVGENQIEVEVTAQDGHTKATYRLVVTRQDLPPS